MSSLGLLILQKLEINKIGNLPVVAQTIIHAIVHNTILAFYYEGTLVWGGHHPPCQNLPPPPLELVSTAWGVGTRLVMPLPSISIAIVIQLYIYTIHILCDSKLQFKDTILDCQLYLIGAWVNPTLAVKTDIFSSIIYDKYIVPNTVVQAGSMQ